LQSLPNLKTKTKLNTINVVLEQIDKYRSLLLDAALD